VNAKILIVDDEPKNIELLEALLEPEGYTLIKASNGSEALSLLSNDVPDLMLLDIMMPGLSGFSVLEEIRNNESTRTIPVILLSALQDRENRLKGIDAGADDFISKPFDKAELISRIRTQINLSLLRRQISEKEKLFNIMELMLEGAAVTDEAFNIEQMNNTALEMLGLKEAQGSLSEFLQEKYGYIMKRNTEKGKFILAGPGTPAAPLFLSVEYRRITQKKWEKCFYVFVFKDVTEENTRNMMKTDFLSLMSHKLRTPLTVISGYAKMLDAFAPDQKFKEMVRAIERNSVILENLIKRILFFVEIENSAKDEPYISLDVREIMELYSGIYKKPFELTIDQDNLKVQFWKKTVVEELIENSFKFNNAELLVMNVQIGGENIIIEDNGSGIPTNEREKVFETFYQVYRNASGNTVGVGLGLSIVKRLAESAGMAIRLEAGKQGGLKVTIEKRPITAGIILPLEIF
jgi:DNA-binding response OmpR family regulator/two-component sensor histidine kinase